MSSDLKNKLDQEPLEFDTSAAWVQLAPKLQSEKRKRRRFLWWWFGGAAGVTMLALVMIYLTRGASVDAAVLNQETVFEQSPNTFNREGTPSAIDEASIAELKPTEVHEPSLVESVSPRSFPVLANQNSAEENNLDQSVEIGRANSGLDLRGINTIDQDEQSLSSGLQNSEDPSEAKRKTDPSSERTIAVSPTSTAMKTRTVSAKNDSSVSDESSKLSEPIKDQSLLAISLLDLDILSIDSKPAEVLGPIPSIGNYKPPPPKPITSKYWQVGVFAGVGYENLHSGFDEGFAVVRGRSIRETRSLRLDITRSINERWAISLNTNLLQRQERYRNTFMYGDTVLMQFELEVQSRSNASLTRLNTGLTVEYQIPRRFCNYALYGGLNIALRQRWSGDRLVSGGDFAPPIEDFSGPYASEEIFNDKLSYVIGARASKDLGRSLQLLVDARAILFSQYNIESGFDNVFSEYGNSYTLNLGLGWRFK